MSQAMARYRWALLACFGWSMAPCAAANIEVRSAVDRVENHIYVIDAQLAYQLSDTALRALDNGVPLTISVEIEIQRNRDYWWNEAIAHVRQKYRLEHHTLSNQYILTDLATRTRRNFTSLDEAIDGLGELKSIPLGELRELRNDGPFLLRLRSRLDISELPTPLRPIAYLSPQWRLSSGWFEWTFEP
jgi:hypothetical protein